MNYLVFTAVFELDRRIVWFYRHILKVGGLLNRVSTAVIYAETATGATNMRGGRNCLSKIVAICCWKIDKYPPEMWLNAYMQEKKSNYGSYSVSLSDLV